jgi:hypothetical protein
MTHTSDPIATFHAVMSTYVIAKHGRLPDIVAVRTDRANSYNNNADVRTPPQCSPRTDICRVYPIGHCACTSSFICRGSKLTLPFTRRHFCCRLLQHSYLEMSLKWKRTMRARRMTRSTRRTNSRFSPHEVNQAEMWTILWQYPSLPTHLGRLMKSNLKRKISPFFRISA